MSEALDRFPKGARQKIIKDLLKPDANINWSIEMATFNRLFKKFPRVEFWMTFSLPFKLNSLRWLMGEGKADLQRAWFKSLLDWQPKSYIVEGNEKVGPDYVSHKKPTLKDILKE